MYLRKNLFALLLCMSMLACNFNDLKLDNLYADNATPIYAVELGFAEYSMSELLEELDTSTLIIDSTSSDVLELRFEIDPFTVTKGDILDDTDIIEFDPVSETKQLRPFRTINLSPVGGTLTNIFSEPKGLFELVDDLANQPIPIILDIDADELIDTLRFEFIADSGSTVNELYFVDGFFRFQLSGLDFQYDLLALNTFDTETSIPLSVDENRNESSPIPLAGSNTSFELVRDIDDPSDDTLNIVEFELMVEDVILQPGESITNSTLVTVDVETGDLTIRSFAGITGAFAEQTFDVDSQSIEFSGLEDLSNGTIEFSDPRIEFYVENYLGLPISIDLSGIRAITNESPDGRVLEILDPTIGDITTVSTFDPDYNNLTPALDTISINNQSTNIDEVFSEIPTNFIFNVTANIENQDGSFVTIPADDEDIFMNLSGLAILPLDARITDVEQTVDFESPDLEDVAEGDSVRVQLSYKNSIPIDISARVGFVNSAMDTTYASTTFNLEKNVEESDFDLIDDRDLEPAAFALNTDEIDLLLDSDNVIVTLTLNSSEGETTRLTTDQKIFFRVAILAGIEIDLNQE